MKPVLVKKAYLPTLGESDLTLDDITSLRWIPSYRRNSFNMQQPVRRNISNIDWETRLMGEEGKKPLPGFAEGRNLTGYFLNPAVRMGALHGDVTFNDKGTLMGIAEKPHYWRTPQQGAADMSIAGEGFRYNQLPKEAFVDLQAGYTPQNAQRALLEWEKGQRIQGKKASESFDDLATSFPEVYDIASILPDTRTENIWGQPDVLNQNPLNDFDASQYKVASEPMEIAMRLLKMPIVPNSLKQREGGYTGQFQDPITNEIMPLHLDGDIDEEYGISANIPERANTEVTGSSLFGSARATGDSATEPDYQRRGYMTALYDALAAMLDKKHSSTLYPNSVQSEEGRKFWGDKESWPVRDDILETGEPMKIAFQLLKERVSPEAKRHKLEYDKKYESSPERVKYREDLNRERRRRGIYGSHDHKDISHTEGGKLTLEGEHENRARHFKDKGTLREL